MPTKFASPAYSATTVLDPFVSVLVVNVAMPPDSVLAPPIMPLVRKFTVPLGVPAPGATGLTVMVNVTFVPGPAGLGEDPITPAVAACVIVSVPGT
jgi:hypothetical protein